MLTAKQGTAPALILVFPYHVHAELAHASASSACQTAFIVCGCHNQLSICDVASSPQFGQAVKAQSMCYRAQRDFLQRKVFEKEGTLADAKADRKETERDRKIHEAIANLKRLFPGV